MKTNEDSEAVGRSGGGWEDWLRRNARKVTEARQAILMVLQKEGRPLSNKEILQAMPVGKCDLTTIYRSIQMLEQLGIVKRFHFGEGAARFALVDETNHSHSHHLVCTRCTKIVEIGECIVRELEDRIVARSHFKCVTHRLEFFGICPECQ